MPMQFSLMILLSLSRAVSCDRASTYYVPHHHPYTISVLTRVPLAEPVTWRHVTDPPSCTSFSFACLPVHMDNYTIIHLLSSHFQSETEADFSVSTVPKSFLVNEHQARDCALIKGTHTSRSASPYVWNRFLKCKCKVPLGIPTCSCLNSAEGASSTSPSSGSQDTEVSLHSIKWSLSRRYHRRNGYRSKSSDRPYSTDMSCCSILHICKVKSLAKGNLMPLATSLHQVGISC
jgi:hypothetical protein